jgi:antitoxin component YwqK of YwqJK toxin-antitoxin module
MRYFIFQILLVLPLLLTAQSKKEQIATLNLRVDSLFKVLVNNAHTLSDKSDKIFQLSQEKSGLEKDIAVCVESKNNTLNALVESNSSLEELKVQLQLTQDEIAKLLIDCDDMDGILFNYYTGIAKLYNEAGELQYEIPFKDGKKEGTELLYDESDDVRVVIRETPYKDGKKDGIEIEYNEYGDMVIRETPYKYGKKEGIQFNMYGEGEFRRESDIPYTNDKVEGICIDTDYYMGTHVETLIMDGETVSKISYDSDHKVVWEVVYKDGEIDEGTIHSFFDDGESTKITIYKSGQTVSEKCYDYYDNEIPCD